jgi:hypothetical protein
MDTAATQHLIDTACHDVETCIDFRVVHGHMCDWPTASMTDPHLSRHLGGAVVDRQDHNLLPQPTEIRIHRYGHAPDRRRCAVPPHWLPSGRFLAWRRLRRRRGRCYRIRQAAADARPPHHTRAPPSAGANINGTSTRNDRASPFTALRHSSFIPAPFISSPLPFLRHAHCSAQPTLSRHLPLALATSCPALVVPPAHHASRLSCPRPIMPRACRLAPVVWSVEVIL